MYRQSKQDKIAKDVKKMVLGRTRYHNGTWGFAGFEITRKKATKRRNRPQCKLGDIPMKRHWTNINGIVCKHDSKGIQFKPYKHADFYVDSKGTARKDLPYNGSWAKRHKK